MHPCSVERFSTHRSGPERLLLTSQAVAPLQVVAAPDTGTADLNSRSLGCIGLSCVDRTRVVDTGKRLDPGTAGRCIPSCSMGRR